MISENPRRRKTPNFKTRLSELRSLSHSLAAELGYCEAARRNVMKCLTGNRYARDMAETQLEVVVEWLRARVAEKDFVQRPYKLEAVSDADAADVLGMVA